LPYPITPKISQKENIYHKWEVKKKKKKVNQQVIHYLSSKVNWLKRNFSNKIQVQTKKHHSTCAGQELQQKISSGN
jgi:hypothetical protein